MLRNNYIMYQMGAFCLNVNLFHIKPFRLKDISKS